MYCTDAQFALSEALDEGTQPHHAVLHHLDECPACARFARRLQSLDRLLEEPTHHQPAAAPAARRAASHRPFTLVAASVAAAVALVATLGLVWQQADQRPNASDPSSAGPALAQLDEPRSAVARTVRTAALLVEPWQREVAALRHEAKRTAAALLDYAPAPGIRAVHSTQPPRGGDEAASPSGDRADRSGKLRRDGER